MAGSRGRPTGGTQTRRTRTATRRSAASRGADADDGIPAQFRDLLAETERSTATRGPSEERPIKRRRVAQPPARIVPSSEPEKPATRSGTLPPSLLDSPKSLPAPEVDTDDALELGGGQIQQTITDDSEDSEEDDEDMEWEEVDLGGAMDEGDSALPQREVGELTIKLGSENGGGKVQRKVRRKGVTGVEKERRIMIHKMHVLLLLHYVRLRNAWCNDVHVQNALRKHVPARALKYLTPDPTVSQIQANRYFLEALKDINLIWPQRFTITARSMQRPFWKDQEDIRNVKVPNDMDPPMDKSDFRAGASALTGSQDLGAQYLCALLRSIGVEARLVCSLQVLPLSFATAGPVAAPPKKPKKKTIYIDNSTPTSAPIAAATAAKNPNDPTELTPRQRAYVPPAVQRIERYDSRARNVHAPVRAASSPKPKANPDYKSPYPTFWVEAFNPAAQRWVPLDPLATNTVDKPHKLEPPLNHPTNLLSYVVAFEEDHVAKDVTRRYAKAYNAKTRKLRLEGVEGPERGRWWRATMRVFRRRGTPLDREQLEDAQLARREAAEGLPRNIMDFKDHPVYVLERHLRSNEVIWPRNVAGKVAVPGSGARGNERTEEVFRRKDVHVVRSADRWYRFGRELKVGEQPLKFAKPRPKLRSRVDEEELRGDDGEEPAQVGLYAAFQTQLYEPPPVFRGRIPRNEYGNLDVYVPSMVPRGGVHLRSPDTVRAARIVDVDAVPAVTGFKFKGRRGEAVIEGAVVAEEFAEAVEAVVEGLQQMRENDENRKRQAECLRMWKRFLIGLRVWERVRREYGGGRGDDEGHEGKDEDFDVDVRQEIDREEQVQRGNEMAGGFLLEDAAAERPAEPTAGGGGFMEDDYEGQGGFFVEDDSLQSADFPNHNGDQWGGGFVRQEKEGSVRKENEPGGFIPEAEEGGGFIREDDGDDEKSRGSVSKDQRAEQQLSNSLDGSDDAEGSGQGGGEDEAPTAGRGRVSAVEIRPQEDEAPRIVGAETSKVIIPPLEEPLHTQDAPPLEDREEHREAHAEEPKASPEPAAEPTEGLSETNVGDPEDSESDIGSLLSHDPEDDEAEPDWL